MGKRYEDISISVAANSRESNVLDGKLFQTLDRPTLITIQETGSAAGLERALVVGSDTKIPNGPVNANNRVPITPDDTIGDGIEGYPGQGMFLTIVNTTAGALTYRARLWLEDAMEL